MPDITIIKLKVRRGTNAQRNGVVLEQGELGYTIDTKRLFVGDGISLGGNPAGSAVLPPLLSTGSRAAATQAVRNDIVNENGLLYQLSGTDYSQLSSWAFIGSRVDNNTIEYDAQNQIKVKNINNALTLFNAGAIVNNSTSGLSANIDNTSVKIVSNQLQVGLISAANISTNVVGSGLQGGAGTPLSIKAGPEFNLISTTLRLTSIPAGIVDANALSGASVGLGLNVTGNKLNTTLQTVDNATIEQDAGQVRLKSIGSGGNTYFKTVAYNAYGQITTSESTITNTFTARNSNASALSVFNGAPDQITEGYSRSTVTQIPVLSSNGITSTTINLSSAGFISFQSADSQLGSGVDRFAIPIYTY